MRATFDIDADLLNAAEAKARATGRSLDAVVEEALRHALPRPASGAKQQRADPFPTFPGGRLRPGVDINNNAAVRDLMDLDTP